MVKREKKLKELCRRTRNARDGANGSDKKNPRPRRARRKSNRQEMRKDKQSGLQMGTDVSFKSILVKQYVLKTALKCMTMSHVCATPR